MLQTRGDAPFSHRALNGLVGLVRLHVVQQHLLDRDVPVQELVAGAPDDAHRTGTELVEQDVAVAKLVHAREATCSPFVTM